MEILDFKPRMLKIQPDEKNMLILSGHSWCNKCESVRPINDFGKDKSNAYGIDPVCRECRKILAEQRRIDHPEKLRENALRYRNKNLDECRARKRQWRKDNIDHVNQYKRDRYSNDALYKMQIVCRQMVKRMFKSTQIKKCYKTQEVLGYTPLQLKEHIESLFKPGMSWDNYGEWHIDHIQPISSATTLFDGIRLSQLENLQPLWAEENLVKGSKLI